MTTAVLQTEYHPSVTAMTKSQPTQSEKQLTPGERRAERRAIKALGHELNRIIEMQVELDLKIQRASAKQRAELNIL